MCEPQFFHQDGAAFTKFQRIAAGSADPGRKYSRLECVVLNLLKVVARDGNDITALVLTKKLLGKGNAVELVDLGADPGCHCHFGECNGKAAVRTVVDCRRSA